MLTSFRPRVISFIRFSSFYSRFSVANRSYPLVYSSSCSDSFRCFTSSSSPLSYNIPPSISSRVGSNLHLRPHHPLFILSHRMKQYFTETSRTSGELFHIHENLNPKVSIQSNFDDLLVPSDHPSRRLTDTFYYDNKYCLRTHTSAHQTQFLRSGEQAFLVIGDCYRRDEIDSRHYPIFHQMEGVRIFNQQDANEQKVVENLKQTLEGLVESVFGPVEKRWNIDSFPFTSPSFELEILFNGQWMEVLGSGVIRKEILERSLGENGKSKIGWAFGIGLERLAMILFEVPDIRLFWSQDERFINQFHLSKQSIKFQPFSKYPACHKDISFWINPNSGDRLFHENDFSALVRELAGDLVERVHLVSSFTHPANGTESRCYRILYRSLTRSMTNSEVDELQAKLREEAEKQLNLKLR
jgi:phenylalanyl-tRNA synthetase alpha chain